MHVIVATRRSIRGHITAHRANISRDLPNLVLGDLVAERRHAIRPPVAYGGDDVVDFTAIDPLVIHERGADPAAAIRMTAVTVEPGEKLFALAELIGILLVALAFFAWLARRGVLARRQRRKCNRLLGFVRGRVGAKRALFALAAGDEHRNEQVKQGVATIH